MTEENQEIRCCQFAGDTFIHLPYLYVTILSNMAQVHSKIQMKLNTLEAQEHNWKCIGKNEIAS